MTQLVAYPMPETWTDTKMLQRRIQRDLIVRALLDAKGSREVAAARLEMDVRALGAACRRLEVTYREISQ